MLKSSNKFRNGGRVRSVQSAADGLLCGSFLGVSRRLYGTVVSHLLKHKVISPTGLLDTLLPFVI